MLCQGPSPLLLFWGPYWPLCWHPRQLPLYPSHFTLRAPPPIPRCLDRTIVARERHLQYTSLQYEPQQESSCADVLPAQTNTYAIPNISPCISTPAKREHNIQAVPYNTAITRFIVESWGLLFCTRFPCSESYIILSCHPATIQGGPLGTDHPPEDNFLAPSNFASISLWGPSSPFYILHLSPL
jgi:hypothetical protein